MYIMYITDHPLKKCNKNLIQINEKKNSFPRSINIWKRLPCSAVSHVIPSVDNIHKLAVRAIRVMQPLYGAALIQISYEADVCLFVLPTVNNSVLFTSYFFAISQLLCLCYHTTPFKHSLSYAFWN